MAARTGDNFLNVILDMAAGRMADDLFPSWGTFTVFDITPR
jgi:hypothetical protein